MENRRLPQTREEIIQRISELEELKKQHPDMDALSSDVGLSGDSYSIWQRLKALPLYKKLLENRAKR